MYNLLNERLLFSFEEYRIPRSTAQVRKSQGSALSPTTVAGRLGVDDGEPSHFGLGKPQERKRTAALVTQFGIFVLRGHGLEWGLGNAVTPLYENIQGDLSGR